METKASDEAPIVIARFPPPAPCPSEILEITSASDLPMVLRSGPGDPHLTAWSYAGLEPQQVVLTLETAVAALASWAPPTLGLPPFAGGAVGYMGYDLAWMNQPKPRSPRPTPLGLPHAHFGLYDAIYARSERTHEGFVIAQPTDAAVHRAERLHLALRRTRGPLGGALVGHLQPLVSPALHAERIREALELIRAGEIYQVNLMCPRVGRYVGSPAASFLRLVRDRPPPFSAYLGLGHDRAVLSASPECFLDFDPSTRRVVTYPIKGTRRRSGAPDEDRALAQELEESLKDRAEHLMIVDLLRNDLGRIAAVGSVRVEACAYLESFPTVHHLTSRISAVLASSHGPGTNEGSSDPGEHAASRGNAVTTIFRAAFPGGSITGAPKLRAMEIIDALEDKGRGVSTGSILYLGPDGRMRSSIAIRTAEFAGNDVHFLVGGGIVADSRPEEEWRETETKAEALSKALLP